MMDLDKLDPNWEVAVEHGQASKTGILPQNASNSTTDLCPCCLNVIYKDPAPICANAKETEFLGFGFPLFYVFLRNCILLLLLSICSYSALSLYWAFNHNYAWCHGSSDTSHRRLLAEDTHTPLCQTFMVQMSRVQDHVTDDQQILRVMTFTLHLCFLIYMRDKIIKLESYYDERTTSISDYSVIVKGIPPQKGIQAKLRKFLNKQFKKPHEIMKITLLPEYEVIKELKEEKMRIIDSMRVHYKNQSLEDEIFVANSKEVQAINKQIKDQAQKMSKMAETDEMMSQKVILIFNTDEEKTQVIQEFQNIDLAKKGPYFGVGAQDITMKEGPEPKEILWDNINVPRQRKYFLYILGWGLSLLLLVIATVVFFFIMNAKAQNLLKASENLHHHPDSAKYQEDFNGAVALVYIMLILVVLFNKLLMVVLFHIFTDLEKHQTSSKYQASFGLKYCLGLFFTTALMTLAVEAIYHQNYYSHLYGVIEEETVMFFLNALFVPLFWLINPFQLVKVIKRKIKFGNRDLTQREAHSLMEESEYDIGKRYAQIIQTMWFTFLYSSIIPIGACISFCGLIFYYWVDKFNLLRRSTLSVEVQGRLVRFTMKLLDFTLIFKVIGQIMFDQQIRTHLKQSSGSYDYVLGSSIVMIIVAFFYLLLPIDQLINFCNPESFNLQQKTYEQMKYKFKDTYMNLHPTYRIANEKQISFKLKKGGMSLGKDNQLENTNEIELKFDKTNSDLV